MTDLLLAYVDGILDDVRRRAVEQHMADCTDCWRYLSTYRQTVALGRALRDEEMPAEVYERLEALVRDGPSSADPS